MTETVTAPGFDEWCVVELMGHRRIAARVRETTIAGAGMLRLDEPDGRTQYYAPSAVYGLHPVSEDVVRAMVEKWRTEPVSRWELPATAAAVVGRNDGSDDEEGRW
jgi:hypothetical protein